MRPLRSLKRADPMGGFGTFPQRFGVTDQGLGNQCRQVARRREGIVRCRKRCA